MKRISFNRKVSRKRRSVIVFAAAAAVGLAFMLGSGVAHGQDNQTEPGSMPCTPLGQDGPPTIPEDTVIKVGDSYYKCIRGQWWKLPRVSTLSQPPVKSSPIVIAQGPSLQVSR